MIDQPPREVVVSGPIRMVIESNGKALAVLSTKGQNVVLRDSFEVSLWLWREKYIPLRFTDYVRRSPFPYKVSGSYIRRKIDAGVGPLIGLGRQAGELMRRVFAGTIRTSARSGQVSGVITLPVGNVSRPMIRSTLGTVPMSEVEQIAAWMAEELPKSIERAAFGEASARANKRQDLAAKAQARNNYKAAQRSLGIPRKRKVA